MTTYKKMSEVKFTEETIIKTIKTMEFETLSHPAGYIMVGSYGKKRTRIFFFSVAVDGKYLGIETPVSNKLLSGKTYKLSKINDFTRFMEIPANCLWGLKK